MPVNVLCGARVTTNYVIYVTKLNAQGAICRKIRPLVRKKGQASLCRRAAAQVNVKYDQRSMNIFVNKQNKNIYIVFKSATKRKSDFAIEKIHSPLKKDKRFNKWKNQGVKEKNDLQSFVLRSLNVFTISSKVRDSVKKRPRSSKKNPTSPKKEVPPKASRNPTPPKKKVPPKASRNPISPKKKVIYKASPENTSKRQRKDIRGTYSEDVENDHVEIDSNAIQEEQKQPAGTSKQKEIERPAQKEQERPAQKEQERLEQEEKQEEEKEEEEHPCETQDDRDQDDIETD